MIPAAASAAAWLASKAMPGPKTIAAIAVVAIAFSTGWIVRGKFAAAAAAKVEAQHARQAAAAAQAHSVALQQARAASDHIVTQAEGIVDHARQLEADLQRDRAAALADGRSLRAQAARITARCDAMANPASPAGGSQATQLPGSMRDGDRLLLVLGSVEGAAEAYAFDSERARNAVDVCNALYNTARQALKQSDTGAPTAADPATRHGVPAKGILP